MQPVILLVTVSIPFRNNLTRKLTNMNLATSNYMEAIAQNDTVIGYLMMMMMMMMKGDDDDDIFMKVILG